MVDEMDSARKHGKAKWSLRGEKGEKRQNVGASMATARTGEGRCCVWLRRVVRGRVGEIRGSGAGGWQSTVCLDAWEPGSLEQGRRRMRRRRECREHVFPVRA